jgi:chorismate dehydratase
MKELQVVPGLSIYTLGPALSSLVISRSRVKLEDDDVVAASGYTETSVRMLQIILRRRGLKIKVQAHPGEHGMELLTKAPFALLIGDEALKSRLASVRLVMDVGEAWWDEFRSPAVFAVSAANRILAGKDTNAVERASELLREAVEASNETLDEVITISSSRSSLPKALLAEYFRTIKYGFDAQVEEGLGLFEREMRSLD